MRKMAKAKTTEKKQVTPIKIDIGCGQRKQEGFVGLDIAAAEGVDLVHDLFTFPLHPHQVGEFHQDCAVERRAASHPFEQLASVGQLMLALERIGQPPSRQRPKRLCS